MADDLKDTIKQNAEGPRQASADGVNVQQHAITDQIRLRRGFGGQVAVDKYLAGKDAVSRDPPKASGSRGQDHTQSGP